MKYWARSSVCSRSRDRRSSSLPWTAKTRPPVPEEIDAFYRGLKAGRYGRVLEAIAGPGQNERDVKVRWNLRRFHGRTLRLYLVDALRSPWGFVSTSQFQLRQVAVR